MKNYIIKSISSLALAVFCFAAVAEVLPKPIAGNFAHGVKFSVSGYEGSGVLENFPVLVKLENGVPSRFSYEDVVSVLDGSDICFIDMQGNGLPFDIEVWDPQGTSYIWVSLPEMTNGTEFVMCYGSNNNKGKDVCSGNPWNSYKGVWHMESTSPVDQANDYDGVGTSQLSITNGVIGNSVWYPNVSGEGISCGATMQNSDLANGFGVEGWINPAVYSGAGDGRAIFGKYQFISFRIFNQNQVTVTTPKVEDHKAYFTLPNANEWYHIALSFQPSTSNGLKLYINGELKSTMKASAVANLTQYGEMWLGRNEWTDQRFYGAIDEMRLSDQIRSADWFRASYDTVSKDDFLTAGIVLDYEQKAEPNAGIIISEIGYTNVVLSVLVGALGTNEDISQDAIWLDSELIISESEDFSSYFLRKQLERFEAPTTVAIPISGLTTNKTYFAKLILKNSFDLSAESEQISFVTLKPGAPSGYMDIGASGFNSFEIVGNVTDFGVGGKSVKVFAEASTTAEFSDVIATEKILAEIGESIMLKLDGLTPNTSYNIRLGIENDWGVITYIPWIYNQTTLDAPAEISNISCLVNKIDPDEFGNSIGWDIIHVEEGATVDVELFIDGNLVQTWDDCGGSMSYIYYDKAGTTHVVKVAATVTLDGVEYKTEKSCEITLGKNRFVVGSLNSYATVVTKVGDTIVLPPLRTKGGYYQLFDIRPFVLEGDGVTLTAVDTGFTSVASYDIEPSTGEFVRSETLQLVISAPTPKGDGCVFVAESRAKDINWSDLTLWTNITNPTAGASYPNGKDDVAIVPLGKDKILNVDINATVGALYIGWNSLDNSSGKIRLGGTKDCTLTFDTSDGSQGLLRITGLSRRDVFPNIDSYFYFGSSDAKKAFNVKIPNGLVFDCGKQHDYKDSDLRYNHNICRVGNGYTTPIEIPKDKVFQVTNVDPVWPKSDNQNTNHSTFKWGSGVSFVGEGTILYDGGAGYFGKALTDFAGTLIVRMKQKYSGANTGSGRGGGYWLYNDKSWGPTNSVLVIEGHFEYPSKNTLDLSQWVANSIGVVIYGSNHAAGSWGPSSNSLHQAGMVMNGGVYYQRSQNNANWVNNNYTSIPNWTEKLVVSNGFSCIGIDSGTATLKNRVEFKRLEQTNRGALCVVSSFVTSTDTPTSENYVIIRGMDAHAIGGKGEEGSGTESIIPWIVAPKQYSDRLYFPYKGVRGDETDVVCFVNKHPTSQVLNDVDNSNANVFVNGTSIALTEDAIVNSLCLNNNGSKGTALGDGRTLTITSGGLILAGNTSAIGKESEYLGNTAGTIYFPNPAYIYSTRQSSSEPNQIWASIVAPKGVAISFPGDFVLGGDQRGIDEELAINGSRVVLGSATTDCLLDVPLRLEGGATTLTLNNTDTLSQQALFLNDHATIGPVVNVAHPGNISKVKKLYVNGVSAPRGTYGSSSSNAEFVDDEHFVGASVIKVLSDDLIRPTTILIF